MGRGFAQEPCGQSRNRVEIPGSHLSTKTRLPGAVTSHTPGFPSHMLAAAVRRAAQSLPARFALCKHTAMPSPLDLLGYRVIGL